MEDVVAGDDNSTRHRILAATAEVLGRNGMTKLSLSEVALQARVSRPTLYRWFASKRDLLDGFVVWERRRKLKAEYQGFTGPQIRDLRLGGTEVTEERRVARFAYLGDSSPEGLDNCEAMYEAHVLVMEMTFVAKGHRKDRIHKFGHMHLDDVVERRARFKNELIIASHFSTRYNGKRIREVVERTIPDMFDGRLQLWI